MYDERADLLTALKAGPAVLRTLMEVVGNRPAAGGEEDWSAVEIICHMRDAERIALERDQLIHAQDRPRLAAYDQNQLAKQNAYARQELETAIDEFEDARVRHVAFLEGLAPADWARVGVHQEMGDITIQQHVAHMAAHDPLHFAQLAQLRAVRA